MFQIDPGQTVLFTGDSITDCGRRGDGRPLGNGYAHMAADLMAARYPDHNLTVINTGIGGNTLQMLADRWTDDVARYNPDWLSILIGINDLHCWLGGTPEQVPPERFAELYDVVLKRAVNESGAKLVLMTPFYMSTEAADESRSHRGRVMTHLPAYIEITREMAARYGAHLVDTHAMFQRLLLTNCPETFGNEPVHPNNTGHLHMAHAWLQAVGW